MRLSHTLAATLALTCLVSRASAEETLEERRARVEQMDADQKEQLLQNYQRFVRLDEAERERLRKLHNDLETAPDAADLRNVLQRYNDWLSDLKENQRAEILSAPPEERLKRIESMRAAQKKQEGFRLGATDVEVMRSWVQKHQLDVNLGKERPEITHEQLDELRQGFSEDGRAKLDEAIAEDAKRGPQQSRFHRSVPRLLFTWYTQAFPRRGPMGWPGGGPGNSGPGQRSGFRRPTETELQDFLKNDLSEKERAELLNLPHDEMQLMLRKMWWRHNFDERQRSGGSGGKGPGERGPGERGPGFGDGRGPGPGQPSGPGDERRPRGPGGPGDKQRDRPRRSADGPAPEKAPSEKSTDAK